MGQDARGIRMEWHSRTGEEHDEITTLNNTLRTKANPFLFHGYWILDINMAMATAFEEERVTH